MSSPIERAVTDAAAYAGAALFVYSFSGPRGAGIVLFVFALFISSAAASGGEDDA